MAAVCRGSTMFNRFFPICCTTTEASHKSTEFMSQIHPMRSNPFRWNMLQSFWSENARRHWAAKLFSRRKYISAIDLGGFWIFGMDLSWNMLELPKKLQALVHLHYLTLVHSCESRNLQRNIPETVTVLGRLAPWSSVYTSWWRLNTAWN